MRTELLASAEIDRKVRELFRGAREGRLKVESFTRARTTLGQGIVAESHAEKRYPIEWDVLSEPSGVFRQTRQRTIYRHFSMGVPWQAAIAPMLAPTTIEIRNTGIQVEAEIVRSVGGEIFIGCNMESDELIRFDEIRFGPPVRPVEEVRTIPRFAQIKGRVRGSIVPNRWIIAGFFNTSKTPDRGTLHFLRCQLNHAPNQ